jgi:hypothetical protein
LKVRMLTLMPANFVPGEPAGVASADPDGDAAGDGSAETDAGGEVVGLADWHAVRTRIGMIAAATNRYRDTAGGPPLASSVHRPAY